jgi:hypothetical protein
MPIEFDSFINNPKFQEATPEVKLRSLDRLSDALFKEGRLDQVEKALQYRASTELGSIAQKPENQFMGSLATGLLGEAADPSLAFGEDYGRIQSDYAKRLESIKGQSNIVQSGADDYFFTRRNPFGTGSLVEHEGGSTYLPDNLTDPNTVSSVIQAAGLKPLKKDAVFGSVLSKIPEYTTTGELFRDNAFMALPEDDKRTLLRNFAVTRNLANDPVGRDEAREIVETMDQGWDTSLRSGQFAPGEDQTGFFDFATKAIDRGASRWAQNEDRKKITYKYDLIRKLEGDLTPEQQEYLNTPGVKDALVAQQEEGIRASMSGQPGPKLKDTLVGTPLEGVSSYKLGAYVSALADPRYKMAEQEYETRNRTMALIGQTEGMQQFQQRQAALKDEGASGWAQARAGIRDLATNPLDVAFNVTLESMVSQPEAMLSNAALFAIPGGQAAGATGMARLFTGFNAARAGMAGVISGASESAYAYTGALEKARQLPDGTQKPLDEVMTDFQQVKAINTEAIKRGAAIGTVSGITAFVLPGAMSQLERMYVARAAARDVRLNLGSNLGFAGTQIAGQVASEASGEYLAQKFSGQEVDIGEIILEAGGGLGDTLTMWQAPDGFKRYNTGRTIQQQADAAVAQARAQAVDAAVIDPQATVQENAPTQGIFARGLSPQIEIGPVDSQNQADITVFVEEAAMEAVPTPTATVDQGLEQTIPETSPLPESIPPDPTVKYNQRYRTPTGETIFTGTTEEQAAFAQRENAIPIEPEPLEPLGTLPLPPDEPSTPQPSQARLPLPALNASQEEWAAYRAQEQGPNSQARQAAQQEVPSVPLSEITEGQSISWLTPEGKVESGRVESLQNGDFRVNGEPQRFIPGKYFSGKVVPNQNRSKLTRGDVLFDGQFFYRYDDETYDDFVVGQKTADGKILFDKTERQELTEGFINDPRVKLYSKADFDTAAQQFNNRENPLPTDRFTDILNNVPAKATPTAAPDTQAGIVEPTEPATTSETPTGPTPAEVNERAATPVLSNPVTNNRTVLFKLRAHKDVTGLLEKAVKRWESWAKSTQILEENPDAIVYVKDAKIQELRRNQAPETFDETVAQLRKEDAANRNARDPQSWTEVPAYRELEKFLKDRVAKTQASQNKNKRSSGILEYAQISTTLEALFIQDKAIAAYTAAKFGLYTPNASLISVEDIASLRYGNINTWVNKGSFTATTGGYEAVNRTLNLGGNASVEDVFHELYHDFFENIAPLILTTGQLTKLQGLIESNLTKPALRSFLEKKGYTLTPLKAKNQGINYEAQYNYRDGLGNISIAAHEAFTQLMTTYHFSQRNPRGVTPETRRILNVISDFFARTFQDWNKEPLPILTDDAKDLLDNFFTTPPPLRRLAFSPSVRSERIVNEAQETVEDIEAINRSLRGEEVYEVPAGPPATLSSPNTLGEVLNERFRLGRAPNLNENFTVGNRTYQLTPSGIFEVIDGVLAYPRDIEDIPYDGQQEFQQTGTTPTNGATATTPETIAEVSSGGPKQKPVVPAYLEKPIRQVITPSSDFTELKGVPPDNILRMAQGMNGTVSLIVEPIDKIIATAASRFRSKTATGEVKKSSMEFARNQVMSQMGMTEQEANAYIFERSNQLKAIAKSNANNQYEVVVNVARMEMASQEPNIPVSVVPVGPVRRIQLPQEGQSAPQSLLVDSTNGQTLAQRAYNPDPNAPQDTEARTGPNVMLEPGDFILIPDSQELARVVANPEETYLEVWDGKKWNRAVYDPKAVRTLFDISKARRYKSGSESVAKGQLTRSTGEAPSQFTLGIAQTILNENGKNYYVGIPTKPKLAAFTELNNKFQTGRLPYADYVAQTKTLLGLPKVLAKSKKARPVGVWENDVTMPKANYRFMYNRQDTQTQDAQDFAVTNAGRRTKFESAASSILTTPREGVVHRDDGTAFSYGKNGIYANVIARKGVKPLMDAISLVRKNGWKKVLHTGPISGPRALDFLRALMAANPDFTFYGSFNQKELESRVESGFLDNKAMTKNEQRNMRLAASQFYASQGTTEADVMNWLNSLPEDQQMDAQFYFEHTPESGTVSFARQKGKTYSIPSFSRRIIGGERTVSASLKGIAEASEYKIAESQGVIDLVSARLGTMKTLTEALRDLARLRNMGPDSLDRAFDPTMSLGGAVGQSALVYYAATILTRYDSLVQDMWSGKEPNDDLALAQDVVYSLTKMIEYLQRSGGRAVNINKYINAYDPQTVIDGIEVDLVKNSPARKEFISKMVAFRKRWGTVAPNWSDEQTLAEMKRSGISPIFLQPVRKFLKNRQNARAAMRDLKAEADAIFVKQRLSPFVSQAVRDNIKELSLLVQQSNNEYVKSMFSQMVHMAIEKERGTGVFSIMAALPYNAALFGIRVIQANTFGSVVTMYANLASFYVYWTSQDLIGGKGASTILSNLKAVVYGHLSPQWAGGMGRAGSANALGVGLSGYRGEAVEALNKSLGTIQNTATALYARQGTKAAERDTGSAQDMLNTLKRLTTIMLIDGGRRAATAPDAFFKTVATSTFAGAQVYRAARDNYFVDRGTTSLSESEYIADWIDRNIGLKPMDHYYAKADAEIRANGDIIMSNSLSVLPRAAELKVLREVMAFAMRNEDRENAIETAVPEGQQVLQDARDYGYSASFSNETKGYAKMIEQLLKALGGYHLEKAFAAIDKRVGTAVLRTPGGAIDYRLRLGAANPAQFALVPFAGFMARSLEELLNWTPVGFVLRGSWNMAMPDTYSKLEVFSSAIKGALGTGVIMAIGQAFGMFDDEDDEDKWKRGHVGYLPKSVFGPNGKETIVPAYSLWWRKENGDIAYFKYQNFPQLMGTIGVMSTAVDARNKRPIDTIGWINRAGLAMFAVSVDNGLYDSLNDATRRLTINLDQDDASAQEKWADTFAQTSRMYMMPLTSLQKDLVGMSRGYEVKGRQGDFWATYVANTYAEGMLSQEARDNLAKAMDANGNVKSVTLLSRFYEELEQPSEGLIWMLDNAYVLQRTDYKKAVATAFPTQATKDRAAVVFEEMNNGMFYVKHAPEIEKAASKYYWPWITEYSKNAERKKELQAFVDSPTNQSRKEQNSPQYVDLRSAEQKDINTMVSKARQIASLEISAEYYTDNPKIKQWVKGIAAKEARKGYNLKENREIKGLRGPLEETDQPVAR